MKMYEVSNRDIRLLDEIFQTDPGFLLNFSDRTMDIFFDDEFSLDINAKKYKVDGTSKMKRFRSFVKTEDGPVVARVLEKLLAYKETYDLHLDKNTSDRFFELISSLKGASTTPETDVLTAFTKDTTLEELILDLRRTLGANKPQVAIDRLHTYCVKRMRHCLSEHGQSYTNNEPLHSLYAKYVNHIISLSRYSDMTIYALRSHIQIMEKYNDIRNNKSLAHDNDILNTFEARYIYDSIISMLRFIQNIDPKFKS